MVPLSDPAQLERWNGRFAVPEYIFGTEPNAFLASQRERLRPGMRALSVADGEGRNSVWLARQGLHVTAFDFSPVGVEKARALARKAGVTVDYRVCDLFEWEWTKAAYDLAVVIFAQFIGPQPRAAFFAGLRRTLAPGGLLVMQGYRVEQLAYATGGPKEPANFYDEALLRESFAGFDILHLASYDAAMAEGGAHRGMSALIDLVARRPG